MKLISLLDPFVHFIRYTEPKAELTVVSYTHDVSEYLKYLDEIEIEDVNDIGYSVISEYIQDLDEIFAYSSIQHKIVSIRQFHQFLLKSGRTTLDPSQYLEIKNKGKRLPHVPSKTTVKKLLTFGQEKPKDVLDAAILRILYRCGLRVSELTNLRFNQVYEQEKWLRITGKGNKERMVPIHNDALALLQKYSDTIRPQWEVKKTDTIFINQKGNPISRQYVDSMIKSRCKELGIYENVSAHSMRHAFATDLLEKGVDLRSIQELLGHQDIQTTQIYTHVQQDTLKKEYNNFLKGGFTNKGGNNDDTI